MGLEIDREDGEIAAEKAFRRVDARLDAFDGNDALRGQT